MEEPDFLRNIKIEPELITYDDQRIQEDLYTVIPKKKNQSPGSTHECLACRKFFASRSILKIHKKFRHHRQFDSLFKCEECKFETKYYNNLVQHINAVHRQNFQYECPYCEKVFKDKSNKNRHVRTIHIIRKINQCTICFKRFSRTDNVNLHMRRFHENDLYQCDKCASSYATKTDLAKHMDKTHIKSFN